MSVYSFENTSSLLTTVSSGQRASGAVCYSRNAKPSPKLAALTAAAAALPAIAQAAAPTDTVMSYRYTSYAESDIDSDRVNSGSNQRYDIKVHQWGILMPLGGSWSVAVNIQDETLSGASPWYNDGRILEDGSTAYDQVNVVMSGASPGYDEGDIVGIEEHRTDGNIGSTYYYDGGSVTGNVAFSFEDDYESVSVGLSTEREFDKKQTVVAVGISYSDDSIFYEDPDRIHKKNNSDPLPDSAGKTNSSFFLSASRILGPNNVLLAGFSYSAKEGYLSDAYKNYDKRPTEREAYTLNLSYRHYMRKLRGAWHLDYRFYDDNWGVFSNTFTAALYKNWQKLQFVPSIRYYGQRAANFYEPFAKLVVDGDPELGIPKASYFADDARLSDYGAFTFGFKFVFKQKPVDWVLGMEYYLADEEFVPGNTDALNHPGMIEYTRFTFGVDHRF